MRLEPLTAREALWAIIAELDLRTPPAELFARVEGLAHSGLEQTALSNFELSDQLADRLAEAHRLLYKIRNDYLGSLLTTDDEVAIRGEIAGVLALPPDLEAMVERRL